MPLTREDEAGRKRDERETETDERDEARFAHPGGCTARKGIPGFSRACRSANGLSGPPAITMATPGVDGRRLRNGEEGEGEGVTRLSARAMPLAPGGDVRGCGHVTVVAFGDRPESIWSCRKGSLCLFALLITR